MLSMTNTQYERLKAYEHHFSTAINSGYVRLPNMQARSEMEKLYTEINGKPYNVEWSCGSCVMSFVKALGKIFYSFTPSSSLADNSFNEVTKAIEEAKEVEVTKEVEVKDVKEVKDKVKEVAKSKVNKGKETQNKKNNKVIKKK